MVHALVPVLAPALGRARAAVGHRDPRVLCDPRAGLGGDDRGHYQLPGAEVAVGRERRVGPDRKVNTKLVTGTSGMDANVELVTPCSMYVLPVSTTVTPSPSQDEVEVGERLAAVRDEVGGPAERPGSTGVVTVALPTSEPGRAVDRVRRRTSLPDRPSAASSAATAAAWAAGRDRGDVRLVAPAGRC